MKNQNGKKFETFTIKLTARQAAYLAEQFSVNTSCHTTDKSGFKDGWEHDPKAALKWWKAGGRSAYRRVLIEQNRRFRGEPYQHRPVREEMRDRDLEFAVIEELLPALA